MDPYEMLGCLPHPFCWFGFTPTLFDAPSRRSREPIDWTAHSFLCFIAPGRSRHETRAISGFSWGFSIQEREISLRPPTILSAAVWDNHLELLRVEYPMWDFAADYQDR
jgi:hypothetical protein